MGLLYLIQSKPMKTLLLLLVVTLTLPVSAQIVNIPDPNFKAALLNHDPVIDTNSDGEIQVSEAEAAIQVVVGNENISDLTGIEAFVNILRLWFSQNQVTTIDTSALINLTQIDFSRNQLTSVDLTDNTNLITIIGEENPMTSLTLPATDSVRFLELENSDLATIDVSVIPNVLLLGLGFNNLTTVDLEDNGDLEYIRIAGNPISTIDFSFNFELAWVDAISTQLETIDLSQQFGLCHLQARNCPNLRYVNIQNGNNENLVNGNCTGVTFSGPATLNLTDSNNLEFVCVDDIAFAEANFTDVPAGVTYLEDCTLNAGERTLPVVNYHPNPVSNLLTISSEVLWKEVRVYSVAGHLLQRNAINATNATLDLSALSNGIYFIQLVGDQSFETFQIIKE